MWQSSGVLGKMQKHIDQSKCSKQYFGTKVTYSSKGKEADLQTLKFQHTVHSPRESIQTDNGN